MTGIRSVIASIPQDLLVRMNGLNNAWRWAGRRIDRSRSIGAPTTKRSASTICMGSMRRLSKAAEEISMCCVPTRFLGTSKGVFHHVNGRA